jgi:(4S)-4-hydroxy-5-phosphonooxypentane-2,3-dione isomerase
MITRIVQMKFREDKISDFLQIFDQSKDLIKGFAGCQGVKLLKDRRDASRMFTISYWESEKHLEAYRVSDLFQNTWSNTKVLFDAKPQAWSLEELDTNQVFKY